jgi:hypothetical protein
MTEIDTGVYGAKRQSFRNGTPRALLRQLVEENKRASEKTIKKMFLGRVRDDDEMIDAIVEYWFANHFRKLASPEEIEASLQFKRQDRSSAAKVAKTAVTNKIIETAKIMLLDLTMGNGKKLRDCTGKDCAKAGGWLTKIAAAIKPTDVVGAVLSETQVRKMWGAA